MRTVYEKHQNRIQNRQAGHRDIRVAPGTKGEKVYIPACVTHSGVDDLVYNDFYIGEGADVVVVAGCGIHADGEEEARHNGIHRFFVGKGAKVVYEEKHVGTGASTGNRRIDPVTEAFLEEDSSLDHGHGANFRCGHHLPQDKRQAGCARKAAGARALDDERRRRRPKPSLTVYLEGEDSGRGFVFLLGGQGPQPSGVCLPHCGHHALHRPFRMRRHSGG